MADVVVQQGGLTRFGSQSQNPGTEQRRAGGESGTPLNALGASLAQKIESKADGWTLPVHVVLQVGIECVIALVDFRGERKHQHVQIEDR